MLRTQGQYGGLHGCQLFATYNPAGGLATLVTNDHSTQVSTINQLETPMTEPLTEVMKMEKDRQSNLASRYYIHPPKHIAVRAA